MQAAEQKEGTAKEGTRQIPAMLYEISRAIVQRILQDRILLALVVIGILGFFMIGKSPREEPRLSNRPEVAAQPAEQQPPIDPKLATDFVTWWLHGAMDFSTATAVQSHQQAFSWMTRDAQTAFQAAFWPPTTAQAVASGQLKASFHPNSIQARAINPDGSVVVGVTGTLITDSGGRPVPHDMLADFLVRRNQDGLRVAGVYNELKPVPGSSVY